MATAWQVRFSSFPPHLPQDHHSLLSQSVSSETTYVSSSALRAELSDERKLALHKMHTCMLSNTHTRIKKYNSDMLEYPGWLGSFLITAEPHGM